MSSEIETASTVFHIYAEITRRKSRLSIVSVCQHIAFGSNEPLRS